MTRILHPADPGYDDERTGFQRAWRHQPGAIAVADSSADVRHAVDHANEQGLAIAVQATGHGLAHPADDGALLISTRNLARVEVEPGTRTARIEAGVRWEQVIDAAAQFGLAPLSGSAPHVGAVSYVLGGGLGLLGRRYGYAADHVRSFEVVTSDGQLRSVSPDSEPDLFWALRGGRDNFGVVTSMEIDLLPVAQLYGGTLAFAGEQASDLSSAYVEWTAGLPDELTSSMSLMTYPDFPSVPEPLRGKYVASIRLAYTGDPAEGEQLIAPLRAVGPRLVDQVEELPFQASGQIYRDPTQPHGFYGVHNAMLPSLDAAALDRLLDLTGPGADAPCIVEVRHLGGALSNPPAVANAVGHREANYVARVLSPLVTEDADTDTARAVHEKAFEHLEPMSIGRCLNFVYGPLTTDEVRTGYTPADYTRLAELKRRYDPANTFRLGHNIPPALSA
ncbi:FAD-binding oxidoreductase [Flindersiella endophytica]